MGAGVLVSLNLLFITPLRADLAVIRTEHREDLMSLRSELKKDLISLRSELKADMVTLGDKFDKLQDRILDVLSTIPVSKTK